MSGRQTRSVNLNSAICRGPACPEWLALEEIADGFCLGPSRKDCDDIRREIGLSDKFNSLCAIIVRDQIMGAEESSLENVGGQNA